MGYRKGVARGGKGGNSPPPPFSPLATPLVMYVGRLIFIYENCEKYIILAYFSKEFNKPFVAFLRVWTKNTNCLEILRKF